jgi:hypothetical protein
MWNTEARVNDHQEYELFRFGPHGVSYDTQIVSPKVSQGFNTHTNPRLYREFEDELTTS